MSAASRIALCLFFIGTMMAGIWFRLSPSSGPYQEPDTSKGNRSRVEQHEIKGFLQSRGPF
jgi:hypothetical protein